MRQMINTSFQPNPEYCRDADRCCGLILMYNHVFMLKPQLPASSSFRANDRECLSTSSTTCVMRMLLRSRFISLPSSAEDVSLRSRCTEYVYVLNLTAKLAGSLLSRGSILDSIFMPSWRAFGGIKERKRRAGFERGEKGLNATRTSVRNLVIIAATVERRVGDADCVLLACIEDR